MMAAGDNVDTARGIDDFVPPRTLFAEWFARDTSREIRATNNSGIREDRRVSGANPYGFLRDPDDGKTGRLDEEAAPVVKRMCQMTARAPGCAPTSASMTKGTAIPAPMSR
jgi:hypothetical protein